MQSENFSKKVKKYSVIEYFFRLLAVMVFSLLCFASFNFDLNPLISFLSSSISFLFITIFSTFILLKETKWIKFFVIAFLIKLIIGLLHYLFFIDPGYFNGAGEYKYLTYEYESVFQGITSFTNLKQQKGLLYFESDIIQATHPEILSFISIPFTFFGNYVMTITPINSFFSLLISINLLLIAKYKFNFNYKRLKYLAILSAYFPITLISSLLWRDVVGTALMSVGITLIYLSKQGIYRYLLLLLACYLFYLHRTIYPILLIFSFILNIVFNKQSKNRKLDFLIKMVTIIIIISFLPFIFGLADTAANYKMASGVFNFNPIILPVKIIIGLIGPFPWTNFLLYEMVLANSYQLQDFLQGTFNISFAIIMLRKYFFKVRYINILNVLGVLLIMSGLFNSYMHVSYVSFGFLFLIPWLITVINLKDFIRIYFNCFAALILLNVIIEIFIGNIGISSLWR